MSNELICLAISIAENLIIDHIFKGTGVTNYRYINLCDIDMCIANGIHSRIAKRTFENQQQIDMLESKLNNIHLYGIHYNAIDYFRTPLWNCIHYTYSKPSELLELLHKNVERAKEDRHKYCIEDFENST